MQILIPVFYETSVAMTSMCISAKVLTDLDSLTTEANNNPESLKYFLFSKYGLISCLPCKGAKMKLWLVAHFVNENPTAQTG